MRQRATFSIARLQVCLPRIAYDWLPGDTKAPTWERWESVARVRPGAKGRIAMRFREELHAIGAVVAGQGVAICSDLLVRKELSEGLLVPLSHVTLEGYGLYLVTLPDRATDATVQTFSTWMRRWFTPLADVPGAPGTGVLAIDRLLQAQSTSPALRDC